MSVRRQGTLARLISTKKIGFLGAVTLLFNAATGPGVPFTAANFQNPGWLFTVVMFILFTVVSSFCILFIVEAMQAIPGNRHFQGKVEYATLINFYFGPITHLVGQAFLFGALQSNAIQNIILSSQATDNLLIIIFGKTCGFSIGKPKMGWMCVTESGDLPSPFGNTMMLFTLGFLVILALVIPLGMSNMDDNVVIQIGSFVLSFLIVAQWDVSAILSGLRIDRMPRSTPPGLSYGQTVGTIMLNLAVTTIVPSWINIKAKDVNVQHVVWTSMWSVTAFFVCSSVFLATGYDIDDSNNILHSLLISGVPPQLTKATVFAFAYAMLVPSIPVSLIISKDNLVQNRVVSDRFGQFLTFVLPWLICIPLQTGTILFKFQTWTSLLFVSVSNFILPLLIYFQCLKFRKVYNSDRVLSQNQLNLLKEIHRQSNTITTFISNKSTYGNIGPGSPALATDSNIAAPKPSLNIPTENLTTQPSEATILTPTPEVVRPTLLTDNVSPAPAKTPSSVSFAPVEICEEAGGAESDKVVSSTVVLKLADSEPVESLDHISPESVSDQAQTITTSQPTLTPDIEQGRAISSREMALRRRQWQPEWLREDVPDPDEEDRIHRQTVGRNLTPTSFFFTGTRRKRASSDTKLKPSSSTSNTELNGPSNSTWSYQKNSNNPRAREIFGLTLSSLPPELEQQRLSTHLDVPTHSALVPPAILEMTTGMMQPGGDVLQLTTTPSGSYEKRISRSERSVSLAEPNQQDSSDHLEISTHQTQLQSPFAHQNTSGSIETAAFAHDSPAHYQQNNNNYNSEEEDDDEVLQIPSGEGYNDLLPARSDPLMLAEGFPRGKQVVRRRFPNDKSELSRLSTLPANPRFRSPAFRSVPRWMPVRGLHVAWTLLVVTSVVTLVNIGLNLLT